MKKKVLSILLAGTMVLSMTACGGSNNTPAADTADSTAEASTETATEETSTEEATEETATEESADTTAAAGAIRLLNGKPEINDQLLELAELYKSETGNEVSIETIGGDTSAGDELKKMYQADNMPDIFVIEANQAATWDGY